MRRLWREEGVKEWPYRVVRRSDAGYPNSLETCLAEEAPPAVTIWGAPKLLEGPLTAFFGSVRCLGRAASLAYDAAQRLRAQGQAVVSGFHSPVERECLRIFLESENPVIVAPARGLGRLRVPAEWRHAWDEGRLLLVSFFPPGMRRGGRRDAHYRNRCAAALAEEVVLVHVEREGKIARLEAELQGWGKKVRRVTG